MANNFTAKDASGSTLTISSTDTGSGVQAPSHRICDATAANFLPTMDAAARKGFVSITDGTNTMPTGDAAARCLFVQITNGTQSMPTMDAAARKGFVAITDGTNTMPTMDAVARKGFVSVTDGTNTMPTLDAVGRAGFVKVTDGTNTQPTGDAVARSIFVKPGDGTNSITVKAASTAALATDTGLVVRPLMPTDGTHTQPTMDAAARAGFVEITDGTNTMPTMDAVGRAGFVKVTDGTHTQPTGDAAARSIFTQLTDGTNGPAAVKAASTGPALTDPALVVSLSPNCGLSKGKARDLAGTVAAVKASAGNLFALQITNAQAATAAYVQLFDLATGSVVLGTTSPDLEIYVPALTTLNLTFPDGIPFATAISIASTTAEKGNTGSAAGVQVFWQYA